jgi:predicted metalloprotease with PDZ domain
MARRRIAFAFVFVLLAPRAFAQTPVAYRLSFPEAAHHLMQVEVTFTSVPPGPLELRMSRSSPGRYALHEFAKNVFDVRITDDEGKALMVNRPNPHEWDVTGHSGTVRVNYRVFGDRLDGTYLAIDSSHAHINMPAAIMWARGLDRRPVTVRFERPTGTSWKVATQLTPVGVDGLSFTAPNLQYLMDSPSEFGTFSMRSFTVPDDRRTPVFRVAVHHMGTDADVDGLARDVETIVREARMVFGEYPPFDGNTYTFIADYLPWAHGDGMEHRNSTVLTSSGALRSPQQRMGLLATVAHEFVHAWNMERIRARDLEPFDFQDADVSGELWFGEGFTSYYDDLLMRRTGLAPFEATLASFAGVINQVTSSPGRQLRSAADMSRLAPFVDAATSIDRTTWDNTFISYYTFGAALGLGLDLALRGQSGSQRSLDTYMQTMWSRFGRPGQKVPGLVSTPYTMADLRAVLAELTTKSFADTFFDRYIEGHDIVDYAALLEPAGLILRRRSAGRAFLAAPLSFQGGGGARVTDGVLFGSALYNAGVERDDLIVSIDGVAVASRSALDDVLAKHKPGDQVPLRFVRRDGETVNATLALEEDPRVEIVPIEQTGGSLTEAQKVFRERWLGGKTKN